MTEAKLYAGPGDEPATNAVLGQEIDTVIAHRGALALNKKEIEENFDITERDLRAAINYFKASNPKAQAPGPKVTRREMVGMLARVVEAYAEHYVEAPTATTGITSAMSAHRDSLDEDRFGPDGRKFAEIIRTDSDKYRMHYDLKVHERMPQGGDVAVMTFPLDRSHVPETIRKDHNREAELRVSQKWPSFGTIKGLVLHTGTQIKTAMQQIDEAYIAQEMKLGLDRGQAEEASQQHYMAVFQPPPRHESHRSMVRIYMSPEAQEDLKEACRRISTSRETCLTVPEIQKQWKLKPGDDDEIRALIGRAKQREIERRAHAMPGLPLEESIMKASNIVSLDYISGGPGPDGKSHGADRYVVFHEAIDDVAKLLNRRYPGHAVALPVQGITNQHYKAHHKEAATGAAL